MRPESLPGPHPRHHGPSGPGLPGPGPSGRSGTGLPAAVLWDMDGTLVDTEHYWVVAQRRLVESHGGRWSAADNQALIGADLRDSARYIRRHGGVDLPLTDIIEALLDVVADQVRDHVPWRPGARELLEDLVARGVPCALVTMSYERLTRPMLDALPAGTFTAVVTGDMVAHGKPHPEPYLTAAARLGVDPAHCVALEDSPPGLASAVAAGVPALGVTNHLPLPPSPGRHILDTLVGLTAHDLGRYAAGLRATG